MPLYTEARPCQLLHFLGRHSVASKAFLRPHGARALLSATACRRVPGLVFRTGSTRWGWPVATDVYGQLRAAIVSGALAPGEPLVETAVAALYGSSRTPVREALRRLEQDGLVQRADRGMQV